MKISSTHGGCGVVLNWWEKSTKTCHCWAHCRYHQAASRVRQSHLFHIYFFYHRDNHANASSRRLQLVLSTLFCWQLSLFAIYLTCESSSTTTTRQSTNSTTWEWASSMNAKSLWFSHPKWELLEKSCHFSGNWELINIKNLFLCMFRVEKLSQREQRSIWN